MKTSTCRFCGNTIYNDHDSGGLDIWSISRTFYDLLCHSNPAGSGHKPPTITSLEGKKALLAAKEIMHRDLMQEIEDLRREITREELQKWENIGVKQ